MSMIGNFRAVDDQTIGRLLADPSLVRDFLYSDAEPTADDGIDCDKSWAGDSLFADRRCVGREACRSISFSAALRSANVGLWVYGPARGTPIVGACGDLRGAGRQLTLRS